MSFRLICVLLAIVAVMVGAGLTFGERVPSPSKITAERGNYNALEGKPAPDFSLKDQNGKAFRLSEQRGKKVILFFNEGIMCYPACWDQMAALGTDKQLNNDSVVSASIVTDERSAWDSAIKKMPELASGTVLYDTDKNVSTTYDVLLLPSSMHRGIMPGHTYIVVDEQGIVRYTSDDPSMGIRNDELVMQISKL